MASDEVERLAARALELRSAGRFDEALEAIDGAIALEPGNASWHNRRGTILHRAWRPAEAIESFDRALALVPGYAAAHTNKGNVLQDLGEHAAAVRSYELAVRAGPRDANAHWNFSLVLLRIGDFERGWREYEWRKQVLPGINPPNKYPMPEWQLELPVKGFTVLVHSEQGLGDTIQFSRYLPWLASLGARVIAEVPGALGKLLDVLPGVDWARHGDAMPKPDLRCHLLSLPLAAQMRGHKVAIGNGYIAPDMERVRAWRERLASTPRPHIGVVWSGSTVHGGDAQRSIPLARLLKALSPGPQYVSLQKEVRPGDTAALQSRADLLDFSTELRDFADTAALCEVLDRVVTVDTSVAHVAGALGKPVELLLPHIADWRWGLDRTDTPWYPTMRLWRQPARGDWDTPLGMLAAQLDKDNACSS